MGNNRGAMKEIQLTGQSMGLQHHSTKRRRWRIQWSALLAGITVVIGTAIVLYPHAASWVAHKEHIRMVEFMQNVVNQPPNDDPAFRTKQFADAHAYNDALAAGAIFEANANIMSGDGDSSDKTLDYWKMLSTTPSTAMGRLRYEALDIDLPTLHGTSDKTLLTSVGHLQGTSLPVGGVGTRSVLTAHRGLPSATLFNDLDKSKVGDTFTLTVLGEVLTYQVTETLVIDPHQTEAIKADPGRDLVTLVTCTPLGINTHRILVTAERILPTPIEDQTAATGPTGLPHFPWWAVVMALVVITVTIYVWRSGYGRASMGKTPRKSTSQK